MSAVPIVVPSTTADYFVLYVNDAVAVAVVRGEAGTTTIAENVAALPVDQYRVEKYLVSDPADVDGDCVDDITELEDGVGMSPVNPTGSAFSISVGAAAIPDSATFERLLIEVRGGRLLKFMVMHMHTDRPAVYFSNANSNPSHFQILEDLGVAHESGMFRGSLSYYPNIAAPDGSLGLFYFDMLLGYEQQDGLDGLEDVRRVYALLAANMGVLDDNLAYRIPNSWLSDLRPHLSSFQDSRVNLLYDDEEFPEAPFISLNPGEGYGLLRNMDPDERPRPRDIVIYESLPNELPRVAGIISTVPQTPLSHVNLRAAQDSIPNAYVRDALSDSTISALLDRHVFYRVTEQGWEMRAATLAEVNAHYDSSRPAEVQRLRRVLTPTTTVSPLSSIGFQHCEEFGVKASNLAVLGKLVSSRGLVPDGFAIPFYFYDEFMKHNGFYEQVEEMLADPDFQSSQDEQVKQLKKLRKNIKDGDSPAWIISALTEMHDTYPVGQSLRYRSSTNNEDLPGFNGAGLYDSKTQKPSETEEDGIDKSLKEVYASLWNYRAFAGREFQRIDHLTVAMGVLVHPNFKDELVNGVAVSADPAFGTSGNYYVNSQVGEDLVTNPEAESLPEEILLRDGGAYHVISLSSQAKPGELLLSNTQLSQLRDNLEQFHSHFSSLYNAGTADPFAMEIEFKITSENMLSIKQARPWIFTPPSPATPPDTTDADALTASLVSPPSQHDGSVFNLRIDFSHPIRDRYVDVKDYAFEVSGGTVTGVTRVDGRSDQWKVVVTPDSNANVQIVLPARRPCSIAGAICTRDGLRLSNRLELTVVGPDGGGTIDRDAGERTPCSGANEPPLANNDSAATTRDEAVLIDVLSNDTDPNSHALIITEVSSPTKGTAARTAQNMINYTPAPDTDGTDSFSYTVSDGEHSTTATVTVTVDTRIQRPNSEPEFPSSEDGARSVDENTPANRNFGTPIAATDADSDGLTYSIFGGDAVLFDVVATSGQLRTKGALNHEGKSSYSFTMSVHDGRDIHNNSDTSVDDTISVTVTVTDVNEAPAVTGTATFTYRENGTAALHTYRVTDPERGEITWLVSGPDGDDFAISEAGVLSFVSPPNHERPADSGSDNVYEVTVMARDDASNPASLSVTVTVTDVNEGPEISGQPTFTIAENDGLSNASYTGVDPEGGTVTRWTVGGRDGGDFSITQGGTVYLRNLPDYERPADSNRDNVYKIAVRAYDGRVYGSFDVTVTVTDVNEPPVIGSRSRDSFTQPENRTSRLYTYSATDPERSTVTWSVTGADGRLFTIDERGQFSFNESSPPDFDTAADVGGDNIYNVTIQARDPEFNTASLAVTVTVTEVNEGPVISRQGNAAGSVAENHPTTQVLATYTASDPERPSVRVTRWSTSGSDGGDFVINALGELRFRNPPDYERPADANRDNVYELTVRASDGRYTGSLEEVQTVTVTDVNEPPTITTTSRTAFIQQENRASNLYTFRAIDPEGGAVAWTAAGTDGSAFTMDERGSLSFSNPPDFENPADAGGDNVYNVTVQARDAASGTASVNVVVTVSDHNENVEPTITTRRPRSVFRENATSAVYTFRASDPQRDLIIWSLRGNDAGVFTFTDTATLTFRSPPDFENPTDNNRDNEYELEVVATDEHSNSDSLTFTITVTDHNEGVEPTITTRRPRSVFRENATSAVYTFRASDPQRDLIIWSLRGNDAGVFTFTDTGTLMFRSPPDFENPTDNNRDNEYELEVVATDEHSNSDSLTFTITVTDVNEGPQIRLERTATTTVPENHPDTGVLADYTATDPENPNTGIFRWSTSGRDGGDFVISELGELRFRSSPDYERPADSNRDNIYEVTVRASDGRTYGMLEEPLRVTVREVNEAPVITTKNRTEFNLRENSTSILYTYRATDQDNDDTITWSVEGTDGEDFAIYNGILTFRLLADFEIPVDADGDNVYEITVVAADQGGLRDVVDAVITITDQPEGPVIAGRSAFTVTENYDIAQQLESYTATDAKDNRPVFPQWSVSGRDGGDFVIDTVSGALAFRNTPDYDRPADSDRDNIYEVTIRAHDSRAYGNLNVTVIVTNVNESAPAVTGRTSHTVRENTASAIYTYRAADADLNDTIAWSTGGDDGQLFEMSDQGALSFRAEPDFENPRDTGRDNVYELEVVATDEQGLRGTLEVAVTVTELNEAPTVSGTATFTIDENQDLPNATYTAEDPEATGGVTTNISWRISGRDGGDFTIDRETGVLTFRTPPDYERPADANRDNVYEVTVRAYDGRNYGDFDVVVTVEDVDEITGPASLDRPENLEGVPEGVLATYSAAGRGILDVAPAWRLAGTDRGDFTVSEQGELAFRNPPDFERPADSNRDNVYNFAVKVSDGSYYATLDVTVTVTPVNEPPAITGRDSLTFRENTPITTRLYTYRGTDPEGDDIAWSLGGDDASDFDISEQGVLTFAAPPDFDSPRGSGTDGNEYLVTVQARDDQANTGELPVTVTVTDHNEGAVITGQDAISVEENRDPTIAVANYSAVDPEGEAITRWSLGGSDANDFTINDNGELTFRSTPDYDRPADSNRDNEYHLTVRAYDGRIYGNLDVTIAVRNHNEHAPVIRSGSRASFTYREEATSALYTYSATDGDKGDVIAWSTAGPDGNLFEFNDRDGLVFTEAPDYENPQDSGADNEYELNVVATDSGALTASLAVTVTVTEVNEGPEFTGITTYSVIEGQDLLGADFTARDPEEPAAAVTSWRLAGSDAGDFTITETGQNSAQLTFRNTPDYDRPADSNRDNEYRVTVRVSDGRYYGSLDVTVTVTDQNEADPVVSGRDSLSVRENTTSTLYTYRATDMDRGATITWSVTGTDGDDFTISEDGGLSFSSNPNYEHPADSNSDNVYEITVVASDGSNEGTLDATVTVTEVNEGPEISGMDTLTVNENHETVVATYSGTDPEDTNADITRWSVTGRDGSDFTINEAGELTFRNPPDFERPADSDRDNEYEVTVRASDGRVYGTHDISIAVEPTDEAPEFQRNSRTSFTYPENRTSALHTYRATDPEGADVTWSLSGDDADDFEIIDDAGVLTFREPPDFDEPADNNEDNNYEVTVVATDQTGHAANMEITVTVTDANEGPELTGSESRTVSENFDEIVTTYTARDPENPDLAISRWSVTGRDGGDFTINEAGELTFRNPPDFERPADSDRDNEYEVTVRASDGRAYGTLNVTVTVDAVDEAPEFPSASQTSFAYPENGTSAIYTYQATDPEASDVTWGLSGTDSSAFSISETGVLAFNDPPDYESPTDSGHDNIYLVTVEASDDQPNTARLEVTVTVTNVTDLGAPRNLQVARDDNGQLKVSWDAPDSGPPPTRYTVQWKQSNADWTDQQDVSEAPVTDKDHTVEGLTDGVEYDFRVIASRDDANSAPSKEATARPRETTPPAVSSAAVDGARITLTFNEALDSDKTPDKSAFAVTVQHSSRDVDAVTVSGSVVTITLVTSVFSDDAVTVQYTAPTDQSAARLQDLAGNAAGPFREQNVSNNTPAADQLTATVSAVPESHDGQFIFEIRFSDEFEISYKTLRDHTFTVTGGTVTNARRLAPPSNTGWEIHITPDTGAAVTIALPATTDCTATSAICTGDLRPLSNEWEVTVPGPPSQ